VIAGQIRHLPLDRVLARSRQDRVHTLRAAQDDELDPLVVCEELSVNSCRHLLTRYGIRRLPRRKLQVELLYDQPHRLTPNSDTGVSISNFDGELTGYAAIGVWYNPRQCLGH
jgi:hypothetical protein